MSKKSNLLREKKRKEYKKEKKRFVMDVIGSGTHYNLVKRIQSEDPNLIKNFKKNTKYKVSEIILDFARPLINECTDNEQIKIAIMTSITAWNLATLSEDKKQEFWNKMNAEIGDSEEATQIINEMINIKKKLYDEYNFIVRDYELQFDIHDNLHLSVAANQLSN
ncbi:MAG: hypothetical protein M1419_04840 [Bacteroidetes bacterium]|nr:hypothetical protein [Bacteroidota bacterium]